MSYLIINNVGNKSTHKTLRDAVDVLLDCVAHDGTDVTTFVENNFAWPERPTREDMAQAIIDDPKQALLGTGLQLHEISEPVSFLLDMMQDAGIPCEAIVMPKYDNKNA